MTSTQKVAPVVPQVDPELARLLVALSPTEEALLKESLLREGVTEHLTVWAGHHILLDGHSRLRIALAHNLPFSVTEIELPDREAARRWVLQRQLSRRNLSKGAAAVLRGRLYLSMARRPGARTDRDGQGRRWASDEVARIFGVNESTVRRDARLVKNLDRIGGTYGEVYKAQLLAGRGNMSRTFIARLARMNQAEQDRILRSRAQEKAAEKADRKKRRTPTATEGSEEIKRTEAATTSVVNRTSTAPLAPCGGEARTATVIGQASPSPAATLVAGREVPNVPHEEGASPESSELVPEPVNAELIIEMEKIWRQMNHCTRLAWIGQPAVQTALRRLDTASQISA